jgi:hypothetical protein
LLQYGKDKESGDHRVPPEHRITAGGPGLFLAAAPKNKEGPQAAPPMSNRGRHDRVRRVQAARITLEAIIQVTAADDSR